MSSTSSGSSGAVGDEVGGEHRLSQGFTFRSAFALAFADISPIVALYAIFTLALFSARPAHRRPPQGVRHADGLGGRRTEERCIVSVPRSRRIEQTTLIERSTNWQKFTTEASLWSRTRRRASDGPRP